MMVVLIHCPPSIVQIDKWTKPYVRTGIIYTQNHSSSSSSRTEGTKQKIRCPINLFFTPLSASHSPLLQCIILCYCVRIINWMVLQLPLPGVIGTRVSHPVMSSTTTFPWQDE